MSDINANIFDRCESNIFYILALSIMAEWGIYFAINALRRTQKTHFHFDWFCINFRLYVRLLWLSSSAIVLFDISFVLYSSKCIALYRHSTDLCICRFWFCSFIAAKLIQPIKISKKTIKLNCMFWSVKQKKRRNCCFHSCLSL